MKDDIKKILDDKGILIRYFNDDSFRITVGSALENDLVVNIIEKVVLDVGEDNDKNIKN